ncbi:hypothetical protein CIHG_03371 [Coccidioides immitis H538.4]|uniref:Uncharacterized protein n=1 Tax=Coccidioides immitis H538.4 TaxID=396776 RepID=A0A0J8UEU4_COCIT|nr:hypothetical protein CIHG_03371 [Coccidioides immitis H538.4]
MTADVYLSALLYLTIRTSSVFPSSVLRSKPPPRSNAAENSVTLAARCGESLHPAHNFHTPLFLPIQTSSPPVTGVLLITGEGPAAESHPVATGHPRRQDKMCISPRARPAKLPLKRYSGADTGRSCSHDRRDGPTCPIGQSASRESRLCRRQIM